LDFCGILWGNGGRLGVKDVRRGLLRSDCGVAGGFDSGLRGVVGMNGRRGGMKLNGDGVLERLAYIPRRVI